MWDFWLKWFVHWYSKYPFRLRCMENGTKNGEKTITKTVSELLANTVFQRCETVKEKQKPHKFYMTASRSPGLVCTLQHLIRTCYGS